MNTELTKIEDIQWLNGWVLYDASCPSCCRFAGKFEPILTRRGFDLAPLQSTWVTECLGERVSLAEMLVITPSGKVFGGAEALVFLARRIWWAWPLYAVAQIPGIRPLLRWAYKFVARHRHCRFDKQRLAVCSRL